MVNGVRPPSISSIENLLAPPFEESLAVICQSLDGKLAEAHYNLALSLDKLGKHEEATTHFKKAAELAPKNPKIVDSPILKKHIGT